MKLLTLSLSEQETLLLQRFLDEIEALRERQDQAFKRKNLRFVCNPVDVLNFRSIQAVVRRTIAHAFKSEAS